MARTRKQPVRQRIIDIATVGIVPMIGFFMFDGMPLPYLTIPFFIFIAVLLATGRYKRGKFNRADTSAALYDPRRVYWSGFRTHASRKAHRGY
jgi:hypothetical protein